MSDYCIWPSRVSYFYCRLQSWQVLLILVRKDAPEEDLQVMLDSGVNFVAETNVLLELALAVDAGDNVVTVARPGDRDLAPDRDLIKHPTPDTPHLHVVQAVADEDGRVGVVPDDSLV